MKYASIYEMFRHLYLVTPDTKTFWLLLMKCRTELNANEMKFGLPDGEQTTEQFLIRSLFYFNPCLLCWFEYFIFYSTLTQKSNDNIEL